MNDQPANLLRSEHLRWLGIALFLISIIFVGRFAYSNWAELAAVKIVNPLSLALAGILYGTCLVFSALSWPILLRGLGSPSAIWPLVRIGLVSQAGKYIPGNFAHYVGRAAMAKAEGVPVTETSISSGLEIVLACIAAVFVGLAALSTESRIWGLVANYAELLPLGILLIGLASIFCAIWLRKRSVRISSAVLPLLLISAALVLGGLSLKFSIESLGSGVTASLAVGVYAAAWLIGFVTPGAPAGIGVREAVIIGAITLAVDGGTAIAAALLHRFLSAVIDGSLSFVAWRLRG